MLMKKIILILSFILFAETSVFAAVTFSDENGGFGLKDDTGAVLIEPQYNKLIPLGDSSYIVMKRGKFGLVNSNNQVLVPIKYPNAERLLGRYLKIGTTSKYGLYNQEGKELLPVEYSTIDILFGGMFLTSKNYKYGVVDSNGVQILENKFDDIYMPKSNIMRIKYQGQWYEIEQIKGETLELPQNIRDIIGDKNFEISEIIEHPAATTGYSVVSAADYFIKIFSSISPSHEETVDALMFSKGADAITSIVKLSWIPKYPVYFVKNYYNNLKNPHNGPLSDVKSELRRKIQ